jgi:hypothetical protein
MENFDEIKKLWSESKGASLSDGSLSSEYIDDVISKRIKKVRNNFREYFWVSFFYQNLVYGCLTFLIVRYFSRADIVMLSAAGILLYIPFTVIFMKKFKAAFLLNKEGLEYSNDDIWLNLKNSHARMSEFFRLKKRFDWVIVPLNCVLIVVINFILFVPNGFMANIFAGILLLIVWLVIFLVAIRIENKKKFVEPLHQMELIMEDFKE